MVIFAALAACRAPPAPPSTPRIVAAESQAIAMVRILRAEPVQFVGARKNRPRTFQRCEVHGADGSSEPARLVEFH